jgi:hypothetical protein
MLVFLVGTQCVFVWNNLNISILFRRASSTLLKDGILYAHEEDGHISLVSENFTIQSLVRQKINFKEFVD